MYERGSDEQINRMSDSKYVLNDIFWSFRATVRLLQFWHLTKQNENQATRPLLRYSTKLNEPAGIKLGTNERRNSESAVTYV